MGTLRHEIPTHLGVEDRAFYGLSVRQVLDLTGGFSLGYALYNRGDAVPAELRLGLAVACALVAVALALVRPGGRGCEEWAVALLRYLLIPRRGVWRRAEPDPDAGPAAHRWVDHAPRPRWAKEA